MIELDINKVQGGLRRAVVAAENGEPVFFTRNGERVVRLVRCERARQAGGIAFDKLPQILKDLGVRPQTPEEIAAWEKDFQDPAFSREVLGLGDDWDPSR